MEPTASTPTKFCTAIKTKVLFVGDPSVHQTRWQTAAILQKNL